MWATGNGQGARGFFVSNGCFLCVFFNKRAFFVHQPAPTGVSLLSTDILISTRKWQRATDNGRFDKSRVALIHCSIARLLQPAIGVRRGQLIRYRLWSRDKHKINTLFISILAVHPAMMWITCRTSALALGAPWWNRTVKKMLQNAGPAGSYPVNRHISGKNRRNFASWELLMAPEYWGRIEYA